MLRNGETLYNLEIIQYCGGGAYGDVYYCQDISGKKQALKLISKAKIGSDWERELKGITHYRKVTEGLPGLLAIYHVGDDSEFFFYTMEAADSLNGAMDYVPDTLAARLEKGPLPADSLIPILKAILNAITELHHAGFAHRDIKPDNILFVDGTPKLADMGLLSPLSGTLTKIAGTMDFMPPEQRTGDSPTSDHKSRQHSDLYAFGKLIYCCVTGNGADAFPSMPRTLPLTLVNKLFFRLSLRLCDKEPTRRLDVLDDIIKEFNDTEHMSLYGETFSDKLRYGLSLIYRECCSLSQRIASIGKKHWLASLLFFPALVFGSAGLIRNLLNRPDPSSEELARSIQEQKKKADQTTLSKKEFSFFNGKYFVTVPTDWYAYDHDSFVKMRLPSDIKAQRLYGLFESPDKGASTVKTYIAILLLPFTASDLDKLSEQELTDTLHPLLCDDAEILSLKRFTQIGKDTILLTGLIPPSTGAICYIYPRIEHTVAFLAFIPEKNYERDMGICLSLITSWGIH